MSSCPQRCPLRTFGTNADTGRLCVAAGEVEGREDSMACEVALHASKRDSIVLEGCFGGDWAFGERWQFVKLISMSVEAKYVSDVW